MTSKKPPAPVEAEKSKVTTAFDVAAARHKLARRFNARPPKKPRTVLKREVDVSGGSSGPAPAMSVRGYNNEAEKKTVERFEQREARQIEKGKAYASRAEGTAVCEKLLPELAAFMLSREAPSPPDGLKCVICQLKPEELALVALSSLLNAINRRDETPEKKWERSSEAMKLKLRMGRTLHDKCFMRGLLKRDRRAYKKIMQAENRHLAVWRYREPHWLNEEYVRAGNWLLDCVLQKLDGHFVLDRDGFPDVSEAHKEFVLKLCTELVYRDPVFVPVAESLPPWTNWRYGDSVISTTFVRDSHPATKKAFKRIFKNGGIPHIDGVNALQRVGWRINRAMLPVVREFAGKIGAKVSDLQLAEDVATEELLGDKTFYIGMNCDFRGRVYGIPHFNFQREDHVRALFQFAEGMPIGHKGDFNWLEIHVANCGDFDGIGKRSWRERIDWAESQRNMIMRTAQNPAATVGWWCDADAPFSFVAGCIELAGIWETGASYTTRLPICFDASCSGIQHLGLLLRDEGVGRLVNLVPGDDWAPPQDVYQLITDLVIEYLQKDDDIRAGWWLR